MFKGNIDLVKELIEKGEEINPKKENPPLYAASWKGFRDIVELLLKSNANPNLALSKDGQTPLFVASKNGHTEIIKLLLDSNANPNLALTTDGQTPLYQSSKNGYINIVKLLLDSNANPNLALTTMDKLLSIKLLRMDILIL